MKLGDFLNNLAAKIGVQNEQDFIDVLSSSALASQEINDELAQRFDTGLMSLDGAKNNRDVLNHLKPIILKAADERFAALADKYGFSTEMQAEQSTYKKIDLLETKLAATIEDLKKQVNANGGQKSEEVARLTKQISELQQQIANVTATKDKEIADYKAAASKRELDFLINLELNGKRYANQDLGDTNVEIARSLINKALAEQKAILVNEGGKLKLKQAETPSLDFLDSSFKPVSFADFANKLLAEKHLLEVSQDPDPLGGGAHRAPQQPTTVTLNNGKKVDTSNYDAAAAASLADLES